jgi:soluble lytic murein transglycosylase-like protein
MIPNPYDNKPKGLTIEKYERISRMRMALGTISEVIDVILRFLLTIAVIALIAVLVLVIISEIAEPDPVSGNATPEITEAVTVAAPAPEIAAATWEPSEDVPLEPELQVYVHEACEAHDVPEPLVLALIERESGFDPNASNGTCYGLMQIHRINCPWLREAGIDPLEYPGNIDAGVLMLANLLGKYSDPHKALMAYSAGEGGAKKLWSRGIYTSAFSRSVMRAAERYERE